MSSVIFWAGRLRNTSHLKRWRCERAITRNPEQAGGAERTLSVGAPRFAIVGHSRSALHAVRWLAQLGATLTGVKSVTEAEALAPRPLAVFISGDTQSRFDGIAGSGAADSMDKPPALTEIWLWDFEVGRPGTGDFASAVSSVSAVIGQADGPPGVLPAHIAEKWCGLFGASLALSLQVAAQSAGASPPRRIDISAADILRAFAEQNSGNHAGVPYGWRRNGRVAVEHGGVFPQGFFRCRDGFMAIQARSKPDWLAILAALGNPEWSQDKPMQNPFTLSEDDSKVRPLLESELSNIDRRALLERVTATGAPMAPVLSLEEAATWNVFRRGFLDSEGRPRMPYTVRRAGEAASDPQAR